MASGRFGFVVVILYGHLFCVNDRHPLVLVGQLSSRAQLLVLWFGTFRAQRPLVSHAGHWQACCCLRPYQAILPPSFLVPSAAFQACALFPHCPQCCSALLLPLPSPTTILYVRTTHCVACAFGDCRVPLTHPTICYTHLLLCHSVVSPQLLSNIPIPSSCVVTPLPTHTYLPTPDVCWFPSTLSPTSMPSPGRHDLQACRHSRQGGRRRKEGEGGQNKEGRRRRPCCALVVLLPPQHDLRHG